MLVNVLENRITAPETCLPVFNKKYSYLHNCLGHQSTVKIARQHDFERRGSILSIDWTCDGDGLVYCSKEEICVMDPIRFSPRVKLQGEWFKAISSKASNCQLLCVPSKGRRMEFYDVRTSTTRLGIEVPSEALFKAVAWSGDNSKIAVVDKAEGVFLIDLRFPKPFVVFSNKRPRRDGNEDGTLLKESRTESGDCFALEENRDFDASKGGVHGRLEVRSADSTTEKEEEEGDVDIFFENVFKGPPYVLLGSKKSNEEINDVVISSDCNRVLVARNDGKMEIINMSSKDRDILMKENGCEVAGNQEGGSFEDVHNGEDSNSNGSVEMNVDLKADCLLNMHLYSITSITESSNIVATFGSDQAISLLDLNKKTVVSTLRNIDGYVSTMKFNNKNNELFSVGVASERRKICTDSNDTLIFCDDRLRVLGRFDVPGKITSSSWHPHRDILAFSCNSLGNKNTNNTSSSNSGANTSSIHYNKIISNGLNGPNIPFVGFLTIE